ncbi:hypothetical protein Tco_0921928 [Tanacetum coccineum]|uniref:No apical meristem-associated C-terminal domain-containing protein n=1 Tax=Tanacetum coccineum TaxID=301880 RepID=A0ABQ5D3X1_9ASTR
MGHGLAHDSTHGLAPVEDDSLVKEVVPVKAMKVSKRHQKAKTTDNLESKPWTTAEDVTSCKAWCDVSKNIAIENVMKTRGFWSEVIAYFEKEMGEQIRRYDAITSKWKNRVPPIIGAFCAIIDNVERRNDSGSCDITVFQKALAEYEAQYDHDFTLESYWRILKDHAAWKEVEMPLLYKKKIKNGSLEEVTEVRPIGQDRAKKKASSSSRSESSSVAGGGLDDLITDKWKTLKSAS